MAQAGDMEQYRSMMFNAAYNILHNRDDAEDIVQDTMVEVVTCGTKPLKMIEFIRRCTYNNAKDYVRKKVYRQKGVSLLAGFAQDTGDVFTDVAERMEVENMVQMIKTRLHSHPEYKDALLLVVQGRSYKQVAETLGVPLNTVRSRVMRGKRIMRDSN